MIQLELRICKPRYDLYYIKSYKLFKARHNSNFLTQLINRFIKIYQYKTYIKFSFKTH